MRTPAMRGILTIPFKSTVPKLFTNEKGVRKEVIGTARLEAKSNAEKLY